MPTRREVLAASAALALAGCGAKRSAAPQFELTPGVSHFDAFLFAPHPLPVREAIERHRRGLDADAAGYLHAHVTDLDLAVATRAAAYLGVGPQNLAFTDSTTMGLALVYGGVKLAPGDEILTTTHDHYATEESLRLRAERDGVKVRRVKLYDDPAQADADHMVATLRAAITPRTAVLAVTWVHSATGVRLPVERLQGLGPLLVVDGVHALAAVDQPATVADVLVAGTHKWLCGPRGTGIVATTEWDQLRPLIPTFTSSAFTPGGYHSYEHRWALAEAFAYQSQLGRSAVVRRITTLATRLKDGLATLDHVTLVTPRDPDLSAGIVCFDVAGYTPERAVDALRAHGILASVPAPYRVTHARLGTSLHVDEDDVDRALEVVKTLRG